MYMVTDDAIEQPLSRRVIEMERGGEMGMVIFAHQLTLFRREWSVCDHAHTLSLTMPQVLLLEGKEERWRGEAGKGLSCRTTLSRTEN